MYEISQSISQIIVHSSHQGNIGVTRYTPYSSAIELASYRILVNRVTTIYRTNPSLLTTTTISPYLQIYCGESSDEQNKDPFDKKVQGDEVVEVAGNEDDQNDHNDNGGDIESDEGSEYRDCNLYFEGQLIEVLETKAKAHTTCGIRITEKAQIVYRSIEDWSGDELEDWVAFDAAAQMNVPESLPYKTLYT